MTIIKAGIEYTNALTTIGAETFIDAHRESTPMHELERYMSKVYNEVSIKNELLKKENIYHVIEQDGAVAGFSKMELDIKDPSVPFEKASKMDQLYLVKAYHGLGLGARLMQFNIDYSKSQGENGMWLVVWTKNTTAIRFYERFGFIIAAERDFILTSTHRNPCYIMSLNYY